MFDHLTLPSGRIVPTPVTPHTSADRLAAFLDDRLTPDDRGEAVRHFAECTACRQELTELRRLVRTAPPRHHWRWIAGVAAAVLMLATGIPRLGENNTPTDATRAAEKVESGGEPESITVSGPADAATISAPMVFTWRPVGVNASYLLVVQDSVGNVVVRIQTSDTSAALPPSTALVLGNRYFWSVDARRVNGQSLRSTLHSFRMR